MSNEIIEHESSEIKFTSESVNFYENMISVAIKGGADISSLERLFELKTKHDKEEARKAFTNDFAIFKQNPPKIYKDLINKQYNSSYSSIGNTVNVVAESMAPHGFTVRWEYEILDLKSLKVKCILSHRMGHVESAEVVGPPDSSGSKNSLQESKSTRTYLKLETFEAVTGTASEFVNLNDDGNSCNKKEEIKCITKEEQEIITSMIEENGIDLEIFMGWAKLKDVSEIPSNKFSKCVSKINISIKNKAKKVNNENT